MTTIPSISPVPSAPPADPAQGSGLDALSSILKISNVQAELDKALNTVGDGGATNAVDLLHLNALSARLSSLLGVASGYAAQVKEMLKNAASRL